MPNIIVLKGDDGKLHGFGERGEAAMAKLNKRVRDMQPGETMALSWKEPRSPGFHRIFFARLGGLFHMQEQFDDEERLRAWLIVGAGECDFVPGPTGRMVALPKSIAWEKLDEVEFERLVKKVDEFLWTDHAQRFLWPHLTSQQTNEMIETLRREFF